MSIDQQGYSREAGRLIEKWEEKTMMYCCSNCRYVFKGSREQRYCPDYGKEYIRHATKKEIDEFIGFQREYHPEEWPEADVILAAG